MEVTGQITKFLDQVTGQKKDGSGEWVKQNFILETGDQYNNLYCFEVFGKEKVDNLNKFNKVGDTVTVEFNVQTNEWQGKYFTSLQAWLIKKPEQLTPETVADNGEAEGDLPF